MIRYKQTQRRPKRVVNKERQTVSNAEKKFKQNSTASGFYSSFLTVVLLQCLVEKTM